MSSALAVACHPSRSERPDIPRDGRARRLALEEGRKDLGCRRAVAEIIAYRSMASGDRFEVEVTGCALEAVYEIVCIGVSCDASVFAPPRPV